MADEIIESVLKDFPGARYYPKYRLTTWHPVGVLDEALADKLVDFIEYEEFVQEAPFDRYADLSAVEVQLSLEHVLEVARRRRGVKQPVHSAIFGDETFSFAIAQTYERLMKDAVMITVRAFQDRQEAAQWLGVPASILRRPAKDG